MPSHQGFAGVTAAEAPCSRSAPHPTPGLPGLPGTGLAPQPQLLGSPRAAPPCGKKRVGVQGLGAAGLGCSGSSGQPRPLHGCWGAVASLGVGGTFPPSDAWDWAFETQEGRSP